MNIENENTEFKSRFTEEIYKAVIAFANTEGGVIYVGVDDSGKSIGLKDADGEYTRIANGVRDAIVPDVTMFVRYTLREDGVVCVAVSEGAAKPYCLKGKGLKPGGVYVRQGASSVPASFEQIRRMIMESDGDAFEEMRSMEQALTFEAAEAAFRKYGVEFGREKYRALGMTRNGDALFTNLAFIISDQCAYTTKVAVFGDGGNTVFRDHREFGGSVFRQLEDTFAYLKLCNRTESVFSGLDRIDKPDYPEEALREALLNALVHRDYSFSGSVIINVNDEKMEFISLGGLLPGLSAEDIRLGISQPRNKNLAEMFHRLRLIESYGTGIRRIFRLYENCPVRPVIEATPNAFKMVLPNMNTASAAGTETSPSVSAQMRKVLDYIRANGQITEKEMGELLGLKKTRVYTVAKQMRELDLIEARGRGEEKVYLLKR